MHIYAYFDLALYVVVVYLFSFQSNSIHSWYIYIVCLNIEYRVQHIDVHFVRFIDESKIVSFYYTIQHKMVPMNVGIRVNACMYFGFGLFGGIKFSSTSQDV